MLSVAEPGLPSTSRTFHLPRPQQTLYPWLPPRILPSARGRPGTRGYLGTGNTKTLGPCSRRSASRNLSRPRLWWRGRAGRPEHSASPKLTNGGGCRRRISSGSGDGGSCICTRRADIPRDEVFRPHQEIKGRETEGRPRELKDGSEPPARRPPGPSVCPLHRDSCDLMGRWVWLCSHTAPFFSEKPW